MINIETLENLKNWYFLNPDYATNINELADEIITALGDDKNEIIDYINNSDKYMKSFIAIALDKLNSKFNLNDEIIL